MAISLAITSSPYLLFALSMIVVAIFAYLLKRQKNNNSDQDSSANNEPWPLGVNDNMITDAERSFFGVLKIFLDDRYIICPKVRLSDALFVRKGISDKLRQSVQNRINSKHLDFLLLDPKTMRPVCAIELDDSSHRSSSAQDRDKVKNKALKDAGLNIIRLPARSTYTMKEIETALATVMDLMPKIQSSTQSPNEVLDNLENEKFGPTQDVITVQNEAVLCPRCGVSMLLRKATKGFRAGKNFFGCPNYPQCREIKEISE